MTLFVRDKNFYKTLLMLAIPIILQNLIVTGVGLADNLMVGQLNEVAIAGVTQSNQISFLVHMFTVGVSVAMSVIASQYWGVRNTRSIKNIIAIGIQVTFVVASLIAITAFIAPDKILGLLTDKDDVIKEGMKYLRILAPALFLMSMTNVLISSMRCIETVRIGVLVSVVAFITNIVLNYLLIFGKFGFPKMGVEGAALATLISRVLEFTIIAVYILFVDKKLEFKIKDLVCNEKFLYSDFFRYGLPIIIGDVLWGIAMASQSAIIGRLPEEAAMAAVSIASTVFSIATVFAYSTSSAAGIIIGKTVGERKYDLVKKYAITLQFIFLGLGILAGTLIFVSRGFVVDLYNIEEGTKDMVNSFLLVLAVTSVGTGYQATSLSAIVKSGGDTKFVLFNDMFWMWVVVMPLSLIAAFVLKLPPVVVFACLKCDQILKCFVAVVKINRFRWIKNLTR